jgi:transcription initiation factor TFIIIB Brf1 subunit/transcription initiation factor TFIIB
MIRPSDRRLRADEQSCNDCGHTGQHQQLHRNPEARWFSSLNQKQRQKTGRVEHHAYQSRAHACITFRRQNGQCKAIDANRGSFL